MVRQLRHLPKPTSFLLNERKSDRQHVDFPLRIEATPLLTPLQVPVPYGTISLGFGPRCFRSGIGNLCSVRRVLESYSRRLLPHIRWKPTGRGNVEVLNDTADFYRYFDATPHAEFLFQCVARTIDVDLPEEARFLKAYDGFKAGVSLMIDMPDRLLDLLFRFLHQNGGRLSRRAREKEFVALTDAEIARIEALYADQ